MFYCSFCNELGGAQKYNVALLLKIASSSSRTIVTLHVEEDKVKIHFLNMTHIDRAKRTKQVIHPILRLLLIISWLITSSITTIPTPLLQAKEHTKSLQILQQTIAGSNPAFSKTPSDSTNITLTPESIGGIALEDLTAASVASWGTTAKELPTPRSGMQVISDNYGSIYTFGGRDQNDQPSNVVEAYVPAEVNGIARMEILQHIAIFTRCHHCQPLDQIWQLLRSGITAISFLSVDKVMLGT